MLRYVLVIAAVVGLLAPVARAGFIIDFESDPVGPIGGETLVKIFGFGTVTFTGPGLRIRQFGAPFPDTRVLSTAADGGPIMVTFSGATANFITITNIVNGTYSGEIDIIDGTAFDINNVVIDFQSNSDTFHTLTGPGIASAIYVPHFPGDGFVMDDFTFQIPAPGALGLLGVAGLLGTRRRRRQ